MARNSSGTAPPAARSFVGRERELAELRGGLHDAIAGRGRLFLIVGEAGIGKTRLADELCTAAEARAARVLWGRCWEDGGAPAYWPWVQVLRTLLRSGAARRLTGDMGAGLARIAQIVPEAGERFPDVANVAPPASLEPEHARFPLFDAVTTFLRRTAARRPLIIVLDDLHAADPPSLLLLQFVARELHDTRLLLIGTYRPVEVERHRERAQILANVARHGYRLPLAGLAAADVGRLIAHAAGTSPAADLVAAVYQTTEGNPFFVDEVVRLLLAEGRTDLQARSPSGLQIPHGVREAIRERLRPLSDTCRQVLGIAAVIGREFDLACLEGASHPGRESMLDVLNEAVAGAIVAPVGGSLTHYSFNHALFRETLYDELTPARRLGLHRRIGAAIEQLHAHHLEHHFAELAHHFLQAAAGGDADKAITYATRAGDFAAAQLAYEDAAAHYQDALRALEPAPEDRRHCALLLALGGVQRASGHADARDTFRCAADLARRLMRTGTPGAAELLGRAALGFADRGIGTPQMAQDPTVVGLVDEALVAIDDSDGMLRARLLGRLAMELSFAEDGDQGVVLSQLAVDMARRLADTPTLAATLSNRQFVLWRVDNIADRVSISSEIVQLADHIGDRELALQGRGWRLIDLMGMGDTRTFDAEIDVAARCAEDLRQPRYLWVTANLRAMRALWAGRWQDAETFARQSLALGERVGDQFAAVSPWVQIFVASREQARLAEQETAAKFSVERYPNSPVPRTLLAIIYLDLGRMAEAREQFELLAAENFANLRRERRVGVLPYLAELCSAFGDAERAPVLCDLLSPYAHGIVPYGAVISFGAAAHYMALLAATLFQWDAAREQFEHALALHARTDGRPWLAHTQHEYARFLLNSGDAAERLRAVELAGQALAAANVLQMTTLSTKATALVERARNALQRLPSAPQEESPRARAYAGGGTQQLPADGAAALHPDLTSERERNGKGGRVLSFPTHKRASGAPGHGLAKNQSARADGLEPAAAGTQRRTRTEPEEGIFRLDGEYWSVGDSAAILRLKNTKGLRYIAHLLRYPGREFHATDLVALEQPPAPLNPPMPFAPRSGAPPGARPAVADEVRDPRLDAQAKAAYKRRLEDLREHLDEATRFNDVARAARAREEIEFLTQELARAVGLGGRDRVASSHAERARLNATRAIKAVVKRIGARHPSLGRYLSTTIKTGTFCSYTPDPRLPIHWKL